MHYADLSRECQLGTGPAVRAIGWLERGKPFSVGTVDGAFVARLEAHITDWGRWLPMVAAGLHFCDLGGCERRAGAQNVIIPAQTCVYVAPDLILHYIKAHQYEPPQEFIAAVLSCPEQSSDAYVDRLLPFASTWQLDEAAVRQIAAGAPRRREAAAADKAQREANRGHFKF